MLTTITLKIAWFCENVCKEIKNIEFWKKKYFRTVCKTTNEACFTNIKFSIYYFQNCIFESNWNWNKFNWYKTQELNFNKNLPSKIKVQNTIAKFLAFFLFLLHKLLYKNIKHKIWNLFKFDKWLLIPNIFS